MCQAPSWGQMQQKEAPQLAGSFTTTTWGCQSPPPQGLEAKQSTSTKGVLRGLQVAAVYVS